MGTCNLSRLVPSPTHLPLLGCFIEKKKTIENCIHNINYFPLDNVVTRFVQKAISELQGVLTIYKTIRLENSGINIKQLNARLWELVACERKRISGCHWFRRKTSDSRKYVCVRRLGSWYHYKIYPPQQERLEAQKNSITSYYSPYFLKLPKRNGMNHLILQLEFPVFACTQVTTQACVPVLVQTFHMKHENEPVDGTYFHVNGFVLRLVLTQAKGTSEMGCCYLCDLFSL